MRILSVFVFLKETGALGNYHRTKHMFPITFFFIFRILYATVSIYLKDPFVEISPHVYFHSKNKYISR